MNGATIGIADHSGWAVLVTVADDGMVLERRRVVLIDEGLPAMPHEHEAQALPLEQALALIERVRVSAARHAAVSLDAVANAVDSPIRGVALRVCPPLPPTVAERLRDYRAKNASDTVMYRMALADAARSRGWAVHWYNAKTVIASVCEALHVANLETYFLGAKKTFGSPWDKDHKVATAAALSATVMKSV